MSHHSSANPAERRANVRVPCKLVIELHVGTSSFAVELTNVSTTGIFVQPSLHSPRCAVIMAARLKPQTRLHLRLQIEGNTAAFEARGFVVWQSDFGVGVDLFDITPALQELLIRLVESGGNDPKLLARITAATLIQPR